MGQTHTTGIGSRGKSFLVTEAPSTTDGVEYFSETFTITSAAAATPIIVIADARVAGANRKVYITDMTAAVNGATAWATTANVFIEDTTQVAFLTFAVAGLTANATLFPASANVTMASGFRLGQGGTAGKGIQIRGNANGTGSDLVVTITGVIK